MALVVVIIGCLFVVSFVLLFLFACFTILVVFVDLMRFCVYLRVGLDDLRLRFGFRGALFWLRLF